MSAAPKMCLTYYHSINMVVLKPLTPQKGLSDKKASFILWNLQLGKT